MAACLLVAMAVWGSEPAPRDRLAAMPLSHFDGSPYALPQGADVLVIAVWASGCAPCQGQLANVSALAAAFAGDGQVAFLAVDVDHFMGTAHAAREKALKKLKSQVPLAEDPRAELIRTIEAWSTQGPSAAAKLPMTVTMPAIYVVDAAGHTRADLKYFRDTKPQEFVEKYRPVIELAKKGGLGAGGSNAAVATTIEQESQDVAVSRGKVRLKYPQMTDAQIARTLPDVRRQLAQMFPKASDAKLDAMLARVQEAMRKGEPVEFDSQ
jgi:thiol-disulfide isomerase/thioredoxin